MPRLAFSLAVSFLAATSAVANVSDFWVERIIVRLQCLILPIF